MAVYAAVAGQITKKAPEIRVSLLVAWWRGRELNPMSHANKGTQKTTILAKTAGCRNTSPLKATPCHDSVDTLLTPLVHKAVGKEEDG